MPVAVFCPSIKRQKARGLPQEVNASGGCGGGDTGGGAGKGGDGDGGGEGEGGDGDGGGEGEGEGMDEGGDPTVKHSHCRSAGHDCRH